MLDRRSAQRKGFRKVGGGEEIPYANALVDGGRVVKADNRPKREKSVKGAKAESMSSLPITWVWLDTLLMSVVFLDRAGLENF